MGEEQRTANRGRGVGTSNRPSVLVIVSDDQRYDTIGAMGNPHINTPNLDRLCARGYASERHFCTTPICTPARAEILTGRSSFGNDVPWFGMPIEPGLTLLPEVFQAAGYHTVHVGKWHNDGHPRDKGYDQTHCVQPSDNLNDYAEHGHYVRYKTANGEVAGHSTEVFTNAAVKALSEAPGDKPIFTYLAYIAPHDPHDSPPPFDTMYDPRNIPLPSNYMPEHPFDNGDMVIRDELLETWPRRQAAIKDYVARYYGIIGHMDYNIGRLLGYLESRGMLENTIVLFTGDQGLAVGSHGLLGKENMYDHSIASPFIVSGPGVPADSRSRAMSHHVDILPTLCDLTGIERPTSARDGHSLVPVFRGEKSDVRDEVLCQFYSPEEPGQTLRHTQRALRTKRWKLTWYPQIDRYQLFDLERDGDELVDLIAPWRARHRRAKEAGQSVWEQDKWSAVDLRAPYGPGEVESVFEDLKRRLRVHMEATADPLAAG